MIDNCLRPKKKCSGCPPDTIVVPTIKRQVKPSCTPCCRRDCCLLTHIIPASMGTSAEGEPYAPKNGDYFSMVVHYEGDGLSYIYDSAGIYTPLDGANSGYTKEQIDALLADKDSVAVVGPGAPTSSTKADNVGQSYYDSTNHNFYQCAGITPQGTIPETYTYTWEELATAGDLNNLESDIYNYLNTKVTHVYENVAAMKADTELENGALVATYGWHEVNDDGGALYRVRTALGTDVVDDCSIIQLADNSLIAELVPINETVSAKQFGLIGDGATDNSVKLQILLNKYKHIYLEEGVYLSGTTLNVPSDRVIEGSGTIQGDLDIAGTLGDELSHTAISASKITTSETLTGSELILVHYEDANTPSNNKRQVDKIISTDGKLGSNLVNYSNDYTVDIINSVKNVLIDGITVDGDIIIRYGEDIHVRDVNKLSGRFDIVKSYGVVVENSRFKFPVNGDRIDINSGSSNIILENIRTEGGSTNSDNGAVKVNEVFYSSLKDIVVGAPDASVGYFHGIMIDGCYTEDGYSNNPSYSINVSNVNVADGFQYGIFATLTYHLNITNANIGSNTISISNCRNVNMDSIVAAGFYINGIEDGMTVNVNNSSISSFDSGSRRYVNFVNSYIGSVVLIQASCYLNFTNCEIDSFRNGHVSADSAQYINFNNTVINNTCELCGLRSSHIDVLARCHVEMRSLRDSIVNLSVIGNVNNDSTNIALYNSDQYNYITYSIAESALATTPVQMQGGATANEFGLTNTIVCARMLKANNNDATYTQNFTKFSSAPADGQHYVGEIVLNNAPSNGIFAWVCTVSGTPGTWKAIALEP